MPELFSPGKIGSMELKNRLVRSATAECLATDDGRLTDNYLRAYTQLAKGGVGMIITGNYYVNSIGEALPRMFVLDRDGMVDDMRKVADAVHEHGAKIVAQINHGGRQCDPAVIGTTPLAPSAVRDKLSLVKPRAMTDAEIRETISAFGEAAARVKEAGYDGAQIHGAHGYLVNQFLSGYTNRRIDEWGGPLENRMRFVIEVYKTMREAVGPDFPIMIKINSVDFVKKGVTLEECTATCKKLDELGIDAIEVSGGILERGLIYVKGDLPLDLVLVGRNIIERGVVRLMEKSMRADAKFEDAYFLSSASAIKQVVGVPIITVGGMRDRTIMEEAVQSGKTDYVSICRPFIRQPNLVNRMEKDDDFTMSCVNCNRCSLEIAVHHKPMKCYLADAPK
jgi:2,4-dienoyl-CoA reductase-like NADH-dependent reductase (Old Yellow Enzyme family)